MAENHPLAERFQGKTGQAFLDALHGVAADFGVSDVHFFPRKGAVDLAWRKDGVMHVIAPLAPSLYEDVVRRIKFACKMHLNVTNIPQDGQYAFTRVDAASGQAGASPPSYEVKVRVSSLPSRNGEVFTLRILDPRRGIVPLETLGFPEEIRTQLAGLVKMPHGIFLVTGPTGSGKTTTLYALLSTVVGTGRNIITLEDPVEYELPGITQSQIDAERGYTFALGLRAVLRQDPNVILVGEIRDAETATTAADAALTGHLVLATLHTNSAIESIARLLSMGINTFTLAPAIRGILAQRLVRKICTSCKGALDGCAECLGSGYKDRMSLPELLVLSKSMRDMILERAGQKELEAQAAKDGFKTMRQWGMELVEQGLTDEKEVMRVTA